MKIVADENMPGLESLAGQAHLQRVPGRRLDAATVAGADALLVRSVTRVDAALLRGSRVGFVGSATIGTDHVDLDWLSQAGIRFAHAPGCNALAVTEYVLQAALLWLVSHQRRLAGCSIGVVGCGNVGDRVAALFASLGCTVWRCDPPRQRLGHNDGPWHTLEQALAADIVSLHVPLQCVGPDATRHLLDATRLSRLGPQQLLINTCRGPVIDNSALLAQLRRAQAPATVLDVWEHEPQVPPALFELMFAASPHIAGYSVEGKLRGTAMVLAALYDWWGQPQALEPVSAPEAVWAGDISDEVDLLALLESRYRLRRDQEALADSLTEADPGFAFDELRRQYPQRHELSGVQVEGEVADAWRPALSLLGVGCR